MIGLPPLGAPELQEARDAFRQGLREHGYVEGQNIVIERRSADGKFERIPQLVNELVRLKVDVIVVGSTQVARAARQVTTTVPIVAVVMADPLEGGLAASLARPGAMSRLTYVGGVDPQRLGLLRDAPRLPG
jgi:putative ABC transport system substrate-binding protein